MSLPGKFHWFPEDLFDLATGDARLYIDWWWVTNANGDLCFYEFPRGNFSPQCNQDKALVEKVAKGLNIPGMTCIKQVPLVAVVEGQFS